MGGGVKKRPKMGGGPLNKPPYLQYSKHSTAKNMFQKFKWVSQMVQNVAIGKDTIVLFNWQ